MCDITLTVPQWLTSLIEACPSHGAQLELLAALEPLVMGLPQWAKSALPEGFMSHLTPLKWKLLQAYIWQAALGAVEKVAGSRSGWLSASVGDDTAATDSSSAWRRLLAAERYGSPAEFLVCAALSPDLDYVPDKLTARRLLLAAGAGAGAGGNGGNGGVAFEAAMRRVVTQQGSKDVVLRCVWR